MRIAVLPRDINPYQDCLYSEMAGLGDEIFYVGEWSRSHAMNILALPFELLRARMRGVRTIHIHWVYRFSIPYISGTRVGRRLMRSWYEVVLAVLQLLGIRIIWIAHNVLPHEPVFDDDVKGRRALLLAAAAVVVHDEDVLPALAAFGPLPTSRVVVRHPCYDIEISCSPRAGSDCLRLLFFGNIARYKRVEDIIRAAQLVDGEVQLTIVGACSDREIESAISNLAGKCEFPIYLRLERLSDRDLAAEVSRCDLVVLPFDNITTSGSVLYALSAGRAVLLPALPTLGGLPDDAVIRYVPGTDNVASLAAAINRIAERPADLVAAGEIARRWAASYTWSDLAKELHAVSRYEPTSR